MKKIFATVCGSLVGLAFVSHEYWIFGTAIVAAFATLDYIINGEDK